jgi:hypothetical protein
MNHSASRPGCHAGAGRLDAVDPDVGIDKGSGSAVVAREASGGHDV